MIMPFTIFARNSQAYDDSFNFLGIAFAASVIEGEKWIADNAARYTEYDTWIVEPTKRRLSDD
jgi:hypothetical protein